MSSQLIHHKPSSPQRAIITFTPGLYINYGQHFPINQAYDSQHQMSRTYFILGLGLTVARASMFLYMLEHVEAVIYLSGLSVKVQEHPRVLGGQLDTSLEGKLQEERRLESKLLWRF